MARRTTEEIRAEAAHHAERLGYEIYEEFVDGGDRKFRCRFKECGCDTGVAYLLGNLLTTKKRLPCWTCRLQQARLIVAPLRLELVRDNRGAVVFDATCPCGTHLGRMLWRRIINGEIKTCRCTIRPELEAAAARTGAVITGGGWEVYYGRRQFVYHRACSNCGAALDSAPASPILRSKQTICPCTKIDVAPLLAAAGLRELLPRRRGRIRTERIACGHPGPYTNSTNLQAYGCSKSCRECMKQEFLKELARFPDRRFLRWTDGPLHVVCTCLHGHELPPVRLAQITKAQQLRPCWCTSHPRRSHHLAERFTSLLAATDLDADDLALLGKVVA